MNTPSFIPGLIKKLTLQNEKSKKLSNEVLLQEINTIREFVKAGNPQKVYELSQKFLTIHPKHEYVSYAAAWSVSKMGRLDEAVRFIAPAIEAKPDNTSYLTLRGHSYLKLGLFREAHSDFENLARLKPDDPAVWKNLLKIRAELKIDLPIPPIVKNLGEKLGKAYASRNWVDFDQALHEMEKLDSITHQYWLTLKNDFLTRIGDPTKEWELFHHRCRETNHPLAYTAFCNLMNSCVKTGNLLGVLKELPKFKLLYNKPCPLSYVPAICAIFVRHQEYEMCLSFLHELEQSFSDNDLKADLKLKTFAYRWKCREALGLKEATSEENEISNALIQEMAKTYDPNSACAKIVRECIECWDVLKKNSGRFLLDLRHNPKQTSILQTRIVDALEKKEPFSLMRIMDGESYGFIADSTDPKLVNLAKQIENIWWGRNIEKNLRQPLIDGFLQSIQSADFIGFPFAFRLAQDLDTDKRIELSFRELKYQSIFSGVKNLAQTQKLPKNPTWVDEFCTFSLTEESYISKLIQKASSVVLITCFEIPKFHIFDHPKVSVILIPPHTKVSSICKTPFENAILPEVMKNIEEQLREKLAPGTLLLVSAGFAGKTFMDMGKKAGAVAVDFGAALDDMLGYKTRSTELHAQFSRPKHKRISLLGSHGIDRTNMITKVLVQLEDASKLPGVKWRSYYAGDRQRFSLATGVKLLSPDTLIVSSLLARKMYMYRFNFELGHFELIDSITTTFKGQTTETDLLDIDGEGNIITSNCGNGSLTLYRYEKDKLHFVKDIPVHEGSFIHGVKLFNKNTAAASLISNPLGIHFMDIQTNQPLLYVPTEIKAKDVCFISDTRMVILATHGKLTTEADEGYDSELQLVDFDLQTKTYKVVHKTIFKNCHFDCVVHHQDKLYINEQFRDVIFIVKPNTFERIGEISGYDFPHGIDIRYGMMAVSNYGSNTVDLRSL